MPSTVVLRLVELRQLGWPAVSASSSIVGSTKALGSGALAPQTSHADNALGYEQASSSIQDAEAGDFLDPGNLVIVRPPEGVRTVRP